MHRCILPLPKRAAGSVRSPRGQCTSARFSASRPPRSAPPNTIRHEALTLQHKVENLLEPVFRVGERPSGLPCTIQIWRDILSDAFDNLSTAADRPARVVGKFRLPCSIRKPTPIHVVFPVDEWSGAQDLVTALLEEPLCSDQSQKDTLKNRWEGVNSSDHLTIS
jgi:hypothetical protein